LDTSVKPKIHAARKISFSLQEPVKTKLIEMTEQSVITRVTEPTDWVSSMVVIKKADNSVRICLDPTDLNKAIKRPIYPLPTIEEVIPKLKNAKFFSLLDAKNGYWQVELDYASSILTTFNTPLGRYRWLRLPFGISCASEEY